MSAKIIAERSEETTRGQATIKYRLDVKGQIPTWLAGSLVRNGPINVAINGQKPTHWFDGLAMLHLFFIEGGEIFYSNRFLRTEAYRAVFKQKSLNYLGFAQDPCRSIFKRFFTWFLPSFAYPLHNANINVAKLADTYIALTEIPLPVTFDPHLLDTLGVLDYQDRLPKKRCWESAHPHWDGKEKKTLNYLIDFGMKSHYIVYHIEDGTTRRVPIAKIPVQTPAYMHSFALTPNYIVLVEYPLVVNPINFLIKGKPFIENYTWQPQKGTQFLVIDRHKGSIVGRHRTKPFFAFHHANAYEEQDVLHLDIVTYKNANIIQLFKTEWGGISGEDSHTQVERFSLALNAQKITSQVLFNEVSEFPRINPFRDGRPYRYVYLTSFNSHPANREELLSSKGLCKFDTHTKHALNWSEEGFSPGEAVFVPAPEAKEEDDGVALAVVLNSVEQRSFLLVLDGKSFKELGRAEAPHLIPMGLHGQFFT